MSRPVNPDVPLPKAGVQIEMNVKIIDALDAAALEIRNKHPRRRHLSRAALIHYIISGADLRKLVAKLSEGK